MYRWNFFFNNIGNAFLKYEFCPSSKVINKEGLFLFLSISFGPIG